MRQILNRSMLTVAAASSILAVTGGYATADSDAHGAAVGSPGVLSGNTVSAPIEVPVNACGNTVDVVAAGNAAFGNACANVSSHEHTDAHHAPPASPATPGSGSGSHGSGSHGSGSYGSSPAAPAPGSASHGTASHSTGSHGTGPASGSSGPGAQSPGAGLPGAGGGTAGAGAEGAAVGSPGVLSGNQVQAPVHVPVNACGNTVNVVGLLNPAMGNQCQNVSQSSPVGAPRPTSAPVPDQPPRGSARPPEANPGGPELPVSTVHAAPAAAPVAPARAGEPRLASTGFDGREAGAVGATSVALLLGGAVLYRRGRRTTARMR
jgi:hypothetical protein